MEIYGPIPGTDRTLLIQQAYDEGPGLLLLLLNRGPQPMPLLLAVLGVSRGSVEEWVTELRFVGHDVSINSHDIVALA